MVDYIAIDDNGPVIPGDLSLAFNQAVNSSCGGTGEAMLDDADSLDVYFDERDSSLLVRRLRARTADGRRCTPAPQRLPIPTCGREGLVCLGFDDDWQPVRAGSPVSVWSPKLRLLSGEADAGAHGALPVGTWRSDSPGLQFTPVPVAAMRLDSCNANRVWAKEVEGRLIRHEDAWLKLAGVLDRDRAAAAAWLGSVLAALGEARPLGSLGRSTARAAESLTAYLGRVSACPPALRSLLEPVVAAAAARPQPGAFSVQARALQTVLDALGTSMDQVLHAAGLLKLDRLPDRILRSSGSFARIGDGPIGGPTVELDATGAGQYGLALLVRPAGGAEVRIGDVVVRDGRAGGTRGESYLGLPEGAFHWLPPRRWAGRVLIIARPSVTLIDAALYSEERQ